MTPEFREKLNAKLAGYKNWLSVRQPNGWRLVQYCGVDLVGALDLTAEQVEDQITGLVSEGFCVDWAENEKVAFLRVYEPDGPQPSWEKVFAEENLADVAEILRKAGFDEFGA